VSITDNSGGIQTDEFCKKVATTSTPSVSHSNSLWYISNYLLIPWFGTIQEDLFCLTHDASGHFGADKSYVTLHNTYYWLDMC